MSQRLNMGGAQGMFESFLNRPGLAQMRGQMNNVVSSFGQPTQNAGDPATFYSMASRALSEGRADEAVQLRAQGDNLAKQMRMAKEREKAQKEALLAKSKAESQQISKNKLDAAMLDRVAKDTVLSDAEKQMLYTAIHNQQIVNPVQLRSAMGIDAREEKADAATERARKRANMVRARIDPAIIDAVLDGSMDLPDEQDSQPYVAVSDRGILNQTTGKIEPFADTEEGVDVTPHVQDFRKNVWPQQRQDKLDNASTVMRQIDSWDGSQGGLAAIHRSVSGLFEGNSRAIAEHIIFKQSASIPDRLKNWVKEGLTGKLTTARREDYKLLAKEVYEGMRENKARAAAAYTKAKNMSPEAAGSFNEYLNTLDTPLSFNSDGDSADPDNIKRDLERLRGGA